MEHILSMLKAGDVLTHCYHEKRCGIIDTKHRPISAVKDAIDRGVLLDVGHGVASFSFYVARAMLESGILPEFISSDIHVYNLHGPVFDLVTTMDKFLHLGMPLYEVIRRTTATPAKYLHRENDLGTLKPGAVADIVIADVQTGEFPLLDSEFREEIGKKRIEPQMVFRSGRQTGLLPRPEEKPSQFDRRNTTRGEK
ncbi:MAG: amidohydrolase family protein [Planctomycetes bacterium]|nr:amidohydrolase family protein [Planctomycetota bacterium]